MNLALRHVVLPHFLEYCIDSKQYTFLVFVGLFELGSAICGGAQSSTMLIIGRAISGLGSSGLINGGLTIIAASVPLVRRPSEFSHYAA